MARKKRSRPRPPHQSVTLGGADYVILERADFDALCQSAGLEQPDRAGGTPSALAGLAELDAERGSLGERLVRRRRAVGLTQSALASQAGIRVETLNRIERGRTASPDFATLRKLVEAIEATRHELAAERSIR